MLRKLPIQTFLNLAGALVFAALLLTAGAGTWGMVQSNAGLQRQTALADALHEAMLADMMHDGLRADVTLALLIAADPMAGNLSDATAGAEENIATLQSAMAALGGIDLPPDLAAAAGQAAQEATAYAETVRNVLAAAARGSVAARAQMAGFDVAFEGLKTSLDGFAGALEDFAAATARDVQQHNGRMLTMLLILGAVAAVAVLLGTRWAARHVTEPIRRLRRALQEVATGDFAVRIGHITQNEDIAAIARDIDAVTGRVLDALAEQAQLRDEAQAVISRLGNGLRAVACGDLSQRIDQPLGAAYEELRQHFNHTIHELGEVIARVVGTGSRIQRLTGEMNRASENLSTRSVAQAATLEETAAALEELTSSVREAADTAALVEREMSTARSEAEESGRIVTSAVAAMGEIRQSAQLISQIIGVIDDIAFQTNLLALNAGVEAARAGEAGKGFAVVASEVRALAQRSSQAAREIKDLIGNSTEHIHRGVEQVNMTGAALAHVVSRVAETARMVSAIAASAAEQSRGLSEINTGVAQLDQVTQQNATMAEEAGLATRDLNAQADSLSHLIARFRLPPSSGAPGLSDAA